MIPLSLVIVAGYAILLSNTNSLPGRVIGVLLAASGIWCIVGLNITLLSSGQAPFYKR